MTQNTKWSQFTSLITVFFFWGFVAANNDILIPVFKNSFHLKQVQALLVQWAFYAAYFVGSVVFFIISLRRDILQEVGYKKTLSAGLCVSALGVFLFIPAANMESFWLFLLGLFTVGLGFSIQQIVANPLAIKMGAPETGSHRLTLAGAINSLGTTIGPVILGVAIFGTGGEDTQMVLSDVQLPFGVLGIAFILVAIFMFFSKIEDPKPEQIEEKTEGEEKFSLWAYPQLYLGMLAIFIYVGVEVSIASNLPALLKTEEFGQISEHNIAPFISLYWGSLMIGRWNGGINVFSMRKGGEILAKFLVPFVAFGVIILANTFGKKDVSAFYVYGIWVLGFVLLSFLAGKKPGKTLMIFGLLGTLMMICGLVISDKMVAQYFLISGGLFCSIMWPAIFDLAINGLGKHTGKASSFLIMMILGGGIVPIIQGWICDFDLTSAEGIWGISYTHFSYIVPVFCFLYLAFYGFIAPKVKRNNG